MGSMGSYNPSFGSNNQSLEAEAELFASIDRGLFEYSGPGDGQQPLPYIQRDPISVLHGAYGRVNRGADPLPTPDHIAHALARYALMRKHFSMDRQSSRTSSSSPRSLDRQSSRTASSLKTSNSSWDEVESLDFNGM